MSYNPADDEEFDPDDQPRNVTPADELREKSEVRARLMAEAEDFYEGKKLIVGPPPPSGREPLARLPGSEEVPEESTDLEVFDGGSRNSFFSASFRKRIMEAGLELLNSPSHKVRAMVFHDLLEAQGLINRRGGKAPEEEDFGKPSKGSATAGTLKMLLGDPATAAKVMAAMGELAKGRPNEAQK